MLVEADGLTKELVYIEVCHFSFSSSSCAGVFGRRGPRPAALGCG